MPRPYNSFYQRPNQSDKIIGVVYIDYNDRITEYNVLEESDTHLLCYSQWTRASFKIKKEDAYKDREELKFFKYCQRAHSKPIKKRRKYLESTKQEDFRDRYIKQFPEKLI